MRSEIKHIETQRFYLFDDSVFQCKTAMVCSNTD